MRRAVAAVLATVCLAGCQSAAPAATPVRTPSVLPSVSPSPTPAVDANARLAGELRQAVRDQDFRNLIDQQRGRKLRQTPIVDVSVIELDSRGAPLSAANVLFNPKHPDGVVVPIDKNLSTDQVRWRSWSPSAWESGAGVGGPDVVAGRRSAPISFMSPYPASVFKLMVGLAVLRLVDRGKLRLDQSYSYAGSGGTLCGGPKTKTISEFFDAMMTFSEDASSCALLRLLHSRGEDAKLDRDLVAWGMPSLQLNGGYNTATMGALDTAKLLMIIGGGPGTLWTAPGGKAVTRDILSDSSRKFFLAKLREQGLNQALSTTNWCGRTYPAPGIPQVTADRWLGPGGAVTAEKRKFRQDVRPCNSSAEVTFAHKTGLTLDAGSDAGIVHSLPGKPGRHYIVAILTNLGDRYADPGRPATPAGTFPVKYSEKFGKLGKAIDTFVTGHHNP